MRVSPGVGILTGIALQLGIYCDRLRFRGARGQGLASHPCCLLCLEVLHPLGSVPCVLPTSFPLLNVSQRSVKSGIPCPLVAPHPLGGSFAVLFSVRFQKVREVSLWVRERVGELLKPEALAGFHFHLGVTNTCSQLYN